MTLVVYEGPNESASFVGDGQTFRAMRGVAIDVPADVAVALPGGWVLQTPIVGVELGYAQLTSGAPATPFVNSTSPIAVGLSSTVAVGSRPIVVEFTATIQTITANATSGLYYLFEDGVQIDSRAFSMPAVQFGALPVSLRTRRSPSAGLHTYDIRGSTGNAANTWWFNAAATQLTALHVTQV